MLKRWLALGSFVGSSLWIYFWEWIRSQVYERAQHMLAPYFHWLTLDELGRYGPPAIFIMVGLFLFWRTRPREAPAVVAPALPVPPAPPAPPPPPPEETKIREEMDQFI